AGRVETAAERLAVDGDHLAVGDLLQAGDPTEQALLKLGGLEGGENGVDTVVRGDAGAQVQEARQPVALGPGEAGDGDEVIGATNDGADGDDDDIDQGISPFAAPGLGQGGEVILHTSGQASGHCPDSWGTRLPQPSLGLSKRRKSRPPNYDKLPSVA